MRNNFYRIPNELRFQKNINITLIMINLKIFIIMKINANKYFNTLYKAFLSSNKH